MRCLALRKWALLGREARNPARWKYLENIFVHIFNLMSLHHYQCALSWIEHSSRLYPIKFHSIRSEIKRSLSVLNLLWVSLYLIKLRIVDHWKFKYLESVVYQSCTHQLSSFGASWKLQPSSPWLNRMSYRDKWYAHIVFTLPFRMW